ncbi:hypothetical protein CLOM_g3698 [Closterium sp. NIES-68]|nr:hypothetical protein CLOM_g3698 [Closterium sp. NIES-68]GJP82194.1 hypothetical protein CLOP_g12403 [Closterium sp. NIES-67]
MARMAGRIQPMARALVLAGLIVALASCAPKASAAAASCIASTLPGYDVAVPLGDSLTLHWKTPTSTVLDLALETANAGWVAVGWSADGRMAGSDAVVGNGGSPASVQAYQLLSILPGGQTPTDTFSIGEASVAAGNGGSTVITFSRTEGTGAVPVQLSGASAIIYSASPDGSTTLSYHGPMRGSEEVDFSCKVEGAPPTAAPPIAAPPTVAPPTAAPPTAAPPTAAPPTAAPPTAAPPTAAPPTAAPPTAAPPPPSSPPPPGQGTGSPSPPPPKAGRLAVNRVPWLVPVALLVGLIPFILSVA